MDNDNSINDTETKHGGQRKGAGRKSQKVGDAYSATAKVAVGWINRVAVNAGGEAWEMTPEERDAFQQPIAEILQRWELEGMPPYLALAVAATLYSTGKGRISLMEVGKKAAAKFKKTETETEELPPVKTDNE